MYAAIIASRNIYKEQHVLGNILTDLIYLCFVDLFLNLSIKHLCHGSCMVRMETISSKCLNCVWRTH